MRTVLIYSGGVDSTTLLYDLLDQGHKLRALSVHYGQRHRLELLAAAEICKRNKVEHEVADIGSLNRFMRGSSQTDNTVDVPEGHYAEENMKLTVVPNRNMLMLSIATAWAISTKSENVAYACHAGDHAIYPDCRDEFAAALSAAMSLADWHPVLLLRPYVHLTKSDIVTRGYMLGVPFDLTYSCYKGELTHCGRCGTCVERRLAFIEARIVDPTNYTDRNYALKVMKANESTAKVAPV